MHQLSRSYLFVFLVFILLQVGGLYGCNKTTSEDPNSPTEQIQKHFSVYVTNYPLKYFAERIAGDKVKVSYLITDDIDPAFWQPKSSDIVQMQTGDLIFINGATYEKWLKKVSLPESNLVNTSESFQDKYIKIKDFNLENFMWQLVTLSLLKRID